MRSMVSPFRFVCEDCNWAGPLEHLLQAENPFDHGEQIQGCPHCKAVNTMRSCCDELGCWEPDTCGTPTGNGGYRRTCGTHRPGG